MFDEFIIYDSRVAAGLGRLMVLDAMLQKLPSLPAALDVVRAARILSAYLDYSCRE